MAVQLWGDAFAGWACGLDGEEIDAAFAPHAELSELTARVADELVEIGRDLWRTTGEARQLHALCRGAVELCEIRGDEPIAAVNLLRRHCGGALPDIEDDDPVLRALRWLARDSVPALLVLEPRRGGTEGLDRDRDLSRSQLFSELASAHPALPSFAAAIRVDPRFARYVDVLDTPNPAVEPLFRQRGKSSAGISAYVAWQPFGHQPVSTDSLAHGLVAAAFDRSRLAGRAGVASAVEATADVLEELCRGLAGEGIRVPATIGMRGIAFDDADKVGLDNDLLRLAVAAEGRRTDVDDPVNLTYATTVKLRLDVTADGEWDLRLPGRWRDAPFRDLGRRGREVGLAAQLALPLGDPPIAVSVAWAAVYVPTGEAVVVDQVASRVVDPHVCDAAVRDELRAWDGRVRAAGKALKPQAVTRAVSAFSGRESATDGLVDALIALEALLGGGNPMRMQAGAAWLVHPTDHAARKQTYDAMGALYGARSGAVHDGKEVSAADWFRAVELLREALRGLLDRPQLLAAKSPGTELMLGGL